MHQVQTLRGFETCAVKPNFRESRWKDQPFEGSNDQDGNGSGRAAQTSY